MESSTFKYKGASETFAEVKSICFCKKETKETYFNNIFITVQYKHSNVPLTFQI